MKKKQFLAALLAATCAVSMAVPVFADDEPTLGVAENDEDQDADALKEWNLEVGTTVQKPTLKVTLPKSTAVLVNPYRIEIDTDGGDGTETSFDTVLSPEMDIVNNSGCAIKVGVKGMLQTYTTVSGTASNLPANINASDDSSTPKKLYTITNKDNWDLSTLKVVTVTSGSTTTKVLVKEDTNSAGDTELRQVGTFKEAVMADNGTTLKTAGAITVSGYVASKNIKVATAPMKDVDAEKTNTLFIYVEGKAADGNWATTFDAKAIAGVVDTKTKVMSTTGMMALTAKENTQNILYLGSGETGNVRVTGQAATAPTVSWMSLTDTFETPFTFVIDAVANQAPAAPVLQKVKFTGIAPNGGAAADEITVTAAATTGLTWDAGSEGTNSTITATTDVAGATPNITSSDTSVININAGKLKALDNGTATITLSFTNKGVTSEYTFAITVSGL